MYKNAGVKSRRKSALEKLMRTCEDNIKNDIKERVSGSALNSSG
jgi:hypothetical protein